ncbi:DMT family transporter [Roseobacter sinensis]|uniref:DMT family transporter n=1 Tax=Roseobacter sinensis TaxID=2931391 RepID=A0ABT3BGI0_9RHOB|nr:DMT family transporter [Roseobacter sp. WL0113]MCV3272691.1 DMT family transporter [Roseobacter sp. WL0113]
MPLSHLLFVASAFLLALGSVLAKYLLSLDSSPTSAIDPLPFLTLQLIGGVVFLVTVRLAKGWRMEPFAHLVRPAFAGIILGAGSVGTIMALALVSASEASVVFATQPVLMLGLAWVLLGERFSPAVSILCFAAVGGVIVIVVGGSTEASPFRFAGLAFALMSTVCAAIYTVWMRGLSGKLDFLSALIVVQATACILSAAIWGGAAWAGLAPTRIGTPFLVGSALGTGAIYYGAAFYVYLIGLQKTEASKAGIYLSLVPVFAIGLAWVILAERLGVLQWIGAVIVVVAVARTSAISSTDKNTTGST